MTLKHWLPILLLSAPLAFVGLTGCDDDEPRNPIERAGEEIDDGVEDVEDTVEDIGEDIDESTQR
jgi:hypothetical protein